MTEQELMNAVLAASPTWQVLANWLSERGAPRGERIASGARGAWSGEPW